MADTSAVSVEQRPDAVVVRVLARDLDEGHIQALRDAIAEALTVAPALPYVTDLANVKFVPSLALGALVRLVNEFRARHQRLIFVALQPGVRQVIAITRLDRVIEVMDDVATALKSLAAMGTG